MNFNLLPVKPLVDLVKALTKDEEENGARYWKYSVDSHDLFYSKSMERLVRWKVGEVFDEKTGIHNLAYSIAYMMYLMETDILVREYDEQKKKEVTPPKDSKQ